MNPPDNEQKERLAAVGQAALNMSHGIKNIVQSMRSGQEVMDEALNRNNIDIARRTWVILSQNIQRIQKLSLDMLKFSKAELPQLEPCNLNNLVQSVVEMLLPQASQQSVSITTQLDKNLKSASMDRDQMQDVIINLLINALEAIPDHTGKVTVQTELDQDRRQVILRVTDNGPGIENTHIIFEPFHTGKGQANAGLGLTITRNIISNHGGTIDVQSLPDQGCVFTVSIPLESQKSDILGPKQNT